MTGKCFASRRITSKPNCCFNSLCTSPTDEVSSVSDICTRNFSLISPDGSTSTTTSDFFHATWTFFVVVKVGRFSMACALCPGARRVEIWSFGRPLVGKRYTKRRRLHCGHHWANWVRTHSFSVYEVRLLQVLDVVKASIWWENYLPFFGGNVDPLG